MAEYIDREALIDQIAPDDPCDKSFVVTVRNVKDAFRDIISDFPAADVVEVVRCKECKRYEEAEYDGGSKYVCRLLRRQMQSDDFCSYGERKGGEAE